MMNILIAGGGTGGHLFPGITIAEAFMARHPGNRVLFVGTGRPLEVSVLSKKGFQHECVTAGGLKGLGLRNQALSMLKIPKGIAESLRILRQFRPDVVVGVGGYSAGPVVIGAWLMGIRIALQEQNILPGMTNRILSPFADRIYVSFQDSKSEFRTPQKVRVTGNPVRKEIRNAISRPKHGTRNGESLFTVLIIGGSQGAHSVNMALVETVTHIKKKDRLLFVHQTGNQDIMLVRNAYESEGISCMVRPFFDNMAEQYQHADLIICRAGATTVAEVTAIGKAAIFIPYPYAADDHQVLNVQPLAHAGAAEMILQKDLSGTMLATKIEHYASTSGALEKMASRSKMFGRPDAAEVIVDDLCQLQLVN